MINQNKYGWITIKISMDELSIVYSNQKSYVKSIRFFLPKVRAQYLYSTVHCFRHSEVTLAKRFIYTIFNKLNIVICLNFSDEAW